MNMKSILGHGGLAALLLVITLASCTPRRKTDYSYLLRDKDADSAATTVSPDVKPPSADAVEVSGKGVDRVLNRARAYLGTPYRYGGVDANGIDCSGLTRKAWLEAGVELPRSSLDQSKYGRPIDRKDIRPGDIVCFMARGKGVVDHVGLVTEVKGAEITFIHSSTSNGVRYDRLDIGYWPDKFVCARRVY